MCKSIPPRGHARVGSYERIHEKLAALDGLGGFHPSRVVEVLLHLLEDYPLGRACWWLAAPVVSSSYFQRRSSLSMPK